MWVECGWLEAWSWRMRRLGEAKVREMLKDLDVVDQSGTLGDTALEIYVNRVAVEKEPLEHLGADKVEP
jgi:hypothetical protein